MYQLPGFPPSETTIMYLYCPVSVRVAAPLILSVPLAAIVTVCAVLSVLRNVWNRPPKPLVGGRVIVIAAVDAVIVMTLSWDVTVIV